MLYIYIKFIYLHIKHIIYNIYLHITRFLTECQGHLPWQMLYWQCECNPAAALANHLLLRGPDQWHSVTIAIMSLLGCETWQSVVGLHALFSWPRCAKPNRPGSGIFLAWRRGTTVQPGCAKMNALEWSECLLHRLHRLVWWLEILRGLSCNTRRSSWTANWRRWSLEGFFFM